MSDKCSIFYFCIQIRRKQTRRVFEQVYRVASSKNEQHGDIENSNRKSAKLLAEISKDRREKDKYKKYK